MEIFLPQPPWHTHLTYVLLDLLGVTFGSWVLHARLP